MKLKRYEGNPILSPIKKNDWESECVFNCAAVSLDNKVHIIYRGSDKKGVSRCGYAMSEDGFSISKRLKKPVYYPKNEIEKLGCEDPRISVVEDRIYMSYTAFGEVPGMGVRVHKSIQIAITSIEIDDFLLCKWNWNKPYFPFPGVDNKGSVIYPGRFNGQYVMYHRIPPHVWVAYSEDLRHWYDSNILFSPQYKWEYFKIGTGAPSIKTDYGWLLIHHGVDKKKFYRLGYLITALDDPTRIIYRHPEPILEPEEDFELCGSVPNVVFTCGAVLIGDTVFVYYGGADTVICVATAKNRRLPAPNQSVADTIGCFSIIRNQS